MEVSRQKTYFILWLIVPSALGLNNLITKENKYRVHEFHDHIGRADKAKMMTLAEDLVKDAYLKMRQIKEIREEHEPYSAFNIGVIIGKISEKFRYMIELYKDLYNKDQKRTELIGPGVKVLRLIHYIINMELVHFLEVEIDEFIHVLEVSAHNDMVQGNHMASALRNGPEVEEESSSKEEEEAKVKSRTREEFLMKRLGSNITTTKKRFIDHWPVEETWSLEGANIYQK